MNKKVKDIKASLYWVDKWTELFNSGLDSLDIIKLFSDFCVEEVDKLNKRLIKEEV